MLGGILLLGGGLPRQIWELQKKSVRALHKGNHIIECLLTGLGMPMGMLFRSEGPTILSGRGVFHGEYELVPIIIFFIEIELAQNGLTA